MRSRQCSVELIRRNPALRFPTTPKNTAVNDYKPSSSPTASPRSTATTSQHPDDRLHLGMARIRRNRRGFRLLLRSLDASDRISREPLAPELDHALRLIYEQQTETSQIQGDVVLVSGDTVSNMPLADLILEHRERKK
ncbi:unnamed protein product, partial [Brassica oleracea var. botrytis]